VTHDREEALTLADRIAVIDAGRIAQLGTPDEVFHRPVSPFVAGFMGADNAIEVVHAGDAWTWPPQARTPAPGRARTSAPTARISRRRARRAERGTLAIDGRSRSACTSARNTVIESTREPTASGSRIRSAATRARRCASSCRPTRCSCSRPRPEEAAPVLRIAPPRQENRMRPIRLSLCVALVAAGTVLCQPIPTAAQVTLNVVTAGDQNMVDYVNDFLGRASRS
jgi:hypothetical protein